MLRSHDADAADDEEDNNDGIIMMVMVMMVLMSGGADCDAHDIGGEDAKPTLGPNFRFTAFFLLALRCRNSKGPKKPARSALGNCASGRAQSF